MPPKPQPPRRRARDKRRQVPGRATARKLACIVYQMLKHRQEYRAPDPVAYQLKLDRRRLANLRKQATSLGYELVQHQSVAV